MVFLKMSNYINQPSCQQTKQAQRTEKVQRWNDQIFRGEGGHMGPPEHWARKGPVRPNQPRASAATLLPADREIFTLLTFGREARKFPNNPAANSAGWVSRGIIPLLWGQRHVTNSYVSLDKTTGLTWPLPTPTPVTLKKMLRLV